MANEDLFEFSAKVDIEVEKSSLSKAQGVLDAFYNKYDDRRMKVDTSDMVKAFRGGVREMQKLYDQGVKEMSKNGFSWWDSEDGADDMFNSVRARMQDALKDAKMVFSDGTVYSVLDDALDEIFEHKISKGVTVVAADLGERVQYLRTQIQDVMSDLRDVGAVQTNWRGNVIGFTGDDMSEAQLRDRITLLQDVLDWQKELESFNVKAFTTDNAPTKRITSSIEYDVSRMQETLQDLEEYNSRVEEQYRITTQQLDRRNALISQAQEYLSWDDDDQNRAKSNIENEEIYEESINNLQTYIATREALIDLLRNSEDELFRADGISQYVQLAEKHIEQYKEYLTDLHNFKNGKRIDSDTGFTGDLSEVVEGLGKVEQAVRDVVEAFKPLTDAFANEDSAISRIVNASVSDLERLQEELKETFADIKTLSQKDFINQTVVSQAAPRNNALSTYRNEAKTLLANMVALGKDINSSNISAFKGKVGLTTNDQMFVNNFLIDAEKILKDIKKKGHTVDSIVVVYETLLEQAEYLQSIAGKTNEAIGLRNMAGISIYSEESKSMVRRDYTEAELYKNIDTSAVDAAKSVKDLDNMIRSGSKGFATKDNVTESLDELEALKTKSAAIFNDLQAQLSDLFDFSKINPDYSYIEAITDNIYNKFVDLQTKIGQLGFTITPDANAGATADAIQDERIEAGKVEEAFSDAADAKNKFTEANKNAAQSADNTTPKLEEEGEAAEEAGKKIEQTAGKIIDANDKFDKIKYVDSIAEDGSRTPRSKTTTSTDKRERAYETETTLYKYNEELDQYVQEAVTVVKDFKKRAAELKKEADKIVLAQKTVDKFVSQFESKTAGQASKINGFDGENGLKGFTIKSLEDIDVAMQKMIDLDAEYNKLTKSFRQGSKSMNPFVNAITGMNEMENKIIETEVAFYNLTTKPEKLAQEVDELIPLFASMMSFIGEDANGNKTITDIYGMAEAYGKLNSALRQVNSNIKVQGKINATKSKDANFSLELEKQLSELTKQQALWEKSGQLTDELRAKIDNMFDSLSEVTNSPQLGLWKKQWEIIKNNVTETKYQIDAAKKAQDAVDKTKTSQENDMWAAYEAEKAAAAETERQIELARKQQAAEEAAKAEKEDALSKAYFDKINQQELNELYRERGTIITRIIQLSKKLETLKTDKAKERARKELNRENDRLASIDVDIDEYGDYVNRERIRKQNKRLEDNDVNIAIGKENEDEKASIEQEKKRLEYLITLYKKYAEAQKKLAKMENDPSGASHEQAMADAREDSRKAQEELLSLGINVEKLSESELETQEQKNALLEEEKRLQEEIRNIKSASEDKGQTKENREHQKYGKTITNRENTYAEKIAAKAAELAKNDTLNDDFTNKINSHMDALKRLNELREKFNSDPDAFNNEETKKKFQQTAVEVETLRREIMATFNAAEKFDSLTDDQIIRDDKVDLNKYYDAKEAMIDFAAEVTNGKFKFEGFNAAGTEMYGILDKGEGVIEEVTVALKNGTNHLYAYSRGTKEVASGWQRLTGDLKSEINSLVKQYVGIHELWQAISKGVNYVREIDSALTELKKVTDETDESYNRFLQTMSKSANAIGSTVKDLTTSAADWARLGYSMDEAASLAENTAILMNVSEFDNITNATDTLVSALQAYKNEGMDVADLSMDIINKYNEVGNSYAISTSDLANSLTRSSATLVAAGNSLSESIAMTTAANATIQDPNAVGNALKVVAMRIRGTTSKVLEEMGEDTEGLIESTSKLREQIKGLTALGGGEGIDILADDGSYKSTYEILLEISKVFDKIDDKSQAALLEILAGKQRGSVVAAILQSGELLENVYKSAEGAGNSAMHELETYLDSIQGRIDVFNNSVQTMWMNTIDSEFIKGIVDLGTGFIQLVDNVGLLKSALVGLGVYLSKKYFADSPLFSSNIINATEDNLKSLEDAVARARDAFVVNPTNKQIAKNYSKAKSDLELYKEALNSAGNVTKDAGKKMNGGLNKISSGVAGLGDELLGLAKSMAVMYAITTAIEVVWSIGENIFDGIGGIGKSAEELHDEYQELSDELSNCESEITSLETELKETNKQIEELMSQGTLTFAEQEELERLQSISAELEHQISLKKTLQGSLQVGTSAKAVNAGTAYLHNSFGSQLSKTERQEEAKESGETIGKCVGLIAGGLIAAAIAGVFTGGVGFAAALPTILTGSAIGSVSGELFGGLLGSNIEGDAYNKEQSVADAINNLKDERQKLIDARNEAYSAFMTNQNDDTRTAYENANANLSLYDENMANHINQMSQYYNQIITNWNNASDSQKEKMSEDMAVAKEWGDMIDAYNVKMGGVNAKENALNRIFGDEADEKLQQVKSSIEEIVSNGGDVDLRQAFGADLVAYNEFIDRLYDIGIYAHEAEQYLYGLAKAEDEAVSSSVEFSNIAKDVSGITETVNNLKSAYEEFMGSGLVSADTILELKEVFDTAGLSEEFEEYVSVMMSGTATLEDAKSATEKLVQSYLENRISLGQLTNEEKLTYTIQLQSLGITNAEELIEHELQKTGIDKIESEILNNADLDSSSEAIKDIVSAYGLETDVVDELISKLKEKQDLESDEDAAQNQLDAYKDFKDQYLGLIQDIERINDTAPKLNPYNLIPDDFNNPYAANGGRWYQKEDGESILLTEGELEQLQREYDEYLDKLEELNRLKSNLVTLQSSTDGKKWVNDDGSLKEGVEEEFRKTYEEAQVAVENMENTIEAEFTLEYDLKLQDNVDPNTISDLTAAIEEYKSVFASTSEITSNGQVVTEEYKQSLVDLGIDIDKVNECFDDNNKLVVKDVNALKKLVAQSKKAKQATAHVAKAQAQLEYKELAMRIRDSVVAMGSEYKAYGFVTNATMNNIEAMREQLDVLKETISEYALLEVGLSDAANAYTEYENAKTRDEQLSYDVSFEEMLKTIDEGLLKNETGTEAFEYAVKAVVPEEVYAGLDDVDEKVRAIHDYIDGDTTFAKFFHVNAEDGTLDINADNAREFVNMGITNGVFTGDDAGSFKLSDDVEGIEDIAKAYGITEAAALAMLAAVEKCDATWGDLITDVMTSPLDRAINYAVDDVDKATKALDDYLKKVQDGDVNFNSEVYEQLVADIGTASVAMSEAQIAAQENAKAYTLAQSAINSFRGELKLTDDEAYSLVNHLKTMEGLEDIGDIKVENGQLKLTDEQLTLILQKLGELEKPSVMQVQIRYDEVVSEINALQDYIDNWESGATITIDNVTITNIEDAKSKIADLKPEKEEIEFTYKITETSEDADKSVLESYQELAKNGVEFTVTAKVENAVDGLDSVSNSQKKIKEQQKITFTTNASTIEDAIKSFADEYDRIESKVITLTVNVKKEEEAEVISNPRYSSSYINLHQRVSDALGNARANGSVGLKSAENDAIVGELGPELVCDPIKGIYYTVGENGTEMVNLPRGAIIYNHKQTEELLKNGHTSRGHYTGGLSFAQGNAHANYGIPSYHPNYDADTSFKNGLGINTSWDDATSTLTDAMSDAADSVNEFEETIDWIEIRMEEYDDRIGMLSAELENLATVAEKNAKIDKMITLNQQKYADALSGASYYDEYAQKFLAGMNDDLVAAAKNGAIAITEFTKEQDEATVKAIQNYRDYAQKSADLYQQAEEILTDIRNSIIQKIDNIQDYGSVKTNIEDLQTEKLQNMVDLDETSGLITSSEYYKAMMENSGKKIEYWKPLLADMQKEFDEAVQSGIIEVGSVEWYEQLAKLYEVQAEIDAATIELEEFQNAINQIKWDNFDQLITRLDNIKDETQSLIDLMDNEDMVITPETDDGWSADQVKWTEEGLASLGLYAQQMEVAEYTVKQYAEAIDDLTKDYKAGLYSENEYLEKLNELKQAQYDNIEAYYDAQDAIKDLQNTRVDAIKKGIEKEVDAYEKLINKKKEALSSEKDLHDFQKNASEKSKNIANIERQLVALSNDTSMSAMAKKRKLEAELAEAKAEQEELYYDRSIEQQQNALDKELEDFQEQKDAEIQKWDEYLENVELLVAESLGIVQENAGLIGQTLTDKATEYNLTVSDAIMSPWKDGSLAVSDYQTTFDTAMSSTMNQLEALKNKWQEVIDKMTEAGAASVDTTNKQNAAYAATKKQDPAATKKQEQTKQQENKKNTGSTSTAKVISDKDYYGVTLAILNGGYGWGSGKTKDKNLTAKGFDANKVQDIINKMYKDGYIHNGSWEGKYHGIRLKDLSNYHINKFAKGTNSASKDQLAILDELGEELQLIPGKNGRLEYIKKGTGIVPADLTKKLVGMAMDPQSMLDQNRPTINAPHIINNEINIDCSVDTMVNIEHCDQNNLPDVEKLVNKAFDKHMQTLNNSIRRFAR